VDEQYNNVPQENTSQTFPQTQIPVPPRWLRVVFKTWAIIGFSGLGIMVIAIASSLLSSKKVIGELTEISALYPLVPYGLYVGAFILVLIFLIPFWGAFKLRKWVLPILFILFLLSAINILTILFRQPIQFSGKFIFLILWNTAIVTLTIIALVFRHHFVGSYKKLLPQIVFLVFAIPALAVGSLSLLFPDLPEISDLDLTAYNIVLPPPEENAYFPLIKISEQVYEPTGEANKIYRDFLEGKSWDQAEADSVLSRNENMLTEMRNAASFSYYQCPSTAENLSFTAELCPLNYLTASARMAGLSALSKANKNDFQGAFEDALLPARIGQMIIEEPHITLIDYFVGDAMKRIGLKTLPIILATHDVPSDVLLPRIAELEQYLENEEGLKNAFRHEYLAGKNSLDFVFKVDSNFYFQPNRFFSDMAKDTRQRMALADNQCYQFESELKENQENLAENIPIIAMPKLLFTRNAVFEILKRIISVDTSATQTKRCEADLLIEQARLQMALAAYKFDYGEYPISQPELVPKYLKKAILNPLTNRIFDFNKDTGQIILPAE